MCTLALFTSLQVLTIVKSTSSVVIKPSMFQCPQSQPAASRAALSKRFWIEDASIGKSTNPAPSPHSTSTVGATPVAFPTSFAHFSTNSSTTDSSTRRGSAARRTSAVLAIPPRQTSSSDAQALFALITRFLMSCSVVRIASNSEEVSRSISPGLSSATSMSTPAELMTANSRNGMLIAQPVEVSTIENPTVTSPRRFHVCRKTSYINGRK